jgi:4-carboxymuconolactone decarboxylase
MTRIVLTLLVFGFLVNAQDRMPPIPAEKMTDAQKKAVQDYKDLRKQDLTGPPWSVILRVPDLVVPSLELRLHNLNHSALSPKLTGRAGLSPAILAAVADGRRPEHMAEDEELIYNFCTELLHNQSVSDPTYASMLAKFGEAGIVEAASLEGYYTYLSMIMNTARSPLAPGTKPSLEPFPK